MTENAVEFTRLTKRQGRFTLGPLSFAIPRGGIFGLVGPNGAGKTTTLDLLAGLGGPDSGSVRAHGLDVGTNEVEVKRRLAYAGPETNYAAWRRVGRAIDFVSGFYADWDEVRCAALLETFALERAKPIADLSFGEKNKLSLVMALARDPELLVLDEPTTGLDPAARQFLFADLLRRMQTDQRTIVIATHQLAELERFADRVALLDHGQLRLCADLGCLTERFRQLDIALPAAAEWPPQPGVRLIRRSGDRARVLVDREETRDDWHARLGGATLAESALTLEELYLALVDNDNATAARVAESLT
jgi:ABC-2 type transport system ATP-binding protein